jgi:hypothetical protein
VQFFSMGSRDVLVCVLALLSVACYLIARNEARNQGTTFLASWMWQVGAVGFSPAIGHGGLRAG